MFIIFNFFVKINKLIENVKNIIIISKQLIQGVDYSEWCFV